MNESWKNHKCGECALFNTKYCYLVAYVDEESKACDEFIERVRVENESELQESKSNRI